MSFKLLHLCPDLMNLYGSYGNLWALRRALSALGHTAEITAVNPGEKPDFSADFVFIGAGTERSQKAALEWLKPYAPQLIKAAETGTPMLFAGNSMELLGKAIIDKNQKQYEGLGLAGFCTVQGSKRIVEDVYGVTELYGDSVVGFINKSGIVTGVDSPLISRCELGFGNEAEKGAEGYISRSLIASQLTGPLLVKNPKMLEWVVKQIYQNHGLDLPDAFPHDETELAAYNVTCRELLKRIK